MNRKYTIPRIRRAFEVYKRLSLMERHCVVQRSKGQAGIAVDDDYQALKWQSMQFRMHVIDQWIRGDHINWFFASHLSSEEAKKRNGWSAYNG